MSVQRCQPVCSRILIRKLILRIDPHGFSFRYTREAHGSYCGKIHCVYPVHAGAFIASIFGAFAVGLLSEARTDLRSRAFFIVRRHTPRYSRKHLSASSLLSWVPSGSNEDATESRMKIEKQTARCKIAIEHRCGKSIDRELSALFVTRSYKSNAPRVT